MKKHKGLIRLIYACRYSWQGFKSALQHETAFLQEFILFIALTAVTAVLDISAGERLALIASLLLVLLTEILNSAIECVVDRIGEERHPLSGRAKDYASLSVLLAILIAALTWSTILVF